MSPQMRQLRRRQPHGSQRLSWSLGSLILGTWLPWLLCGSAVSGWAWKCLYKEYPVDSEKIKGIWWIYATYPTATDRCLFKELDRYWTRITMVDYSSFAVELHCSLPWYRHQMAIYTRARDPDNEVLNKVEEYLKSVQLATKDFKLVDQRTCTNQTDVPVQRWHLNKYMHLDYHPHYVKPLVVNDNI
ncbi:uncharacterized protein LOC115633942 [Scaptodrosophila lebanonensis]|uniref:Uncharacterized protein LOC115633942 n=1 Tax=Drosophila lebanonensis TaxID=7225 RepID=A0A6J2UIJ9_DROLE|nr:uncharacterized protein LOC115633942 [Scaptodrosophila lebanonensis]